MNHEIKTFEDACVSLNLNPETILPDFSLFPFHHQKAMVAHSKLIIIAEALNEGWKPDWSNGKWDKYYPWFDMEDSASGGFSYDDYGYWYTLSAVSSRLCFKSRELAEYAGKTFQSIYETLFVIPKN